MAWIFQPIRDIKQGVLYKKMEEGKSIEESTALYNEQLRRKVEPELYVRYQMWQCDIYVDVTMIQVTTKHVYPNVTDEQVAAWIDKHKEPHHYLTY